MLFTEKNGTDHAAGIVSQETGAKLGVLDLGMGGDDGDYESMMDANISALKAGTEMSVMKHQGQGCGGHCCLKIGAPWGADRWGGYPAGRQSSYPLRGDRSADRPQWGRKIHIDPLYPWTAGASGQDHLSACRWKEPEIPNRLCSPEPQLFCGRAGQCTGSGFPCALEKGLRPSM